MGLVQFLIPIAHAQRVVIHARIITCDLLARSPYKARISTRFIDDVKMGEKKKFVPYNLYLLRLFNYHINVKACGSIRPLSTYSLGAKIEVVLASREVKFFNFDQLYIKEY